MYANICMTSSNADPEPKLGPPSSPVLLLDASASAPVDVDPSCGVPGAPDSSDDAPLDSAVSPLPSSCAEPASAPAVASPNPPSSRMSMPQATAATSTTPTTANGPPRWFMAWQSRAAAESI